MARWFYAHGKEQRGPVTAVQLRRLRAQGSISEETLVWRIGHECWQPLSDALAQLCGESDRKHEGFLTPSTIVACFVLYWTSSVAWYTSQESLVLGQLLATRPGPSDLASGETEAFLFAERFAIGMRVVSAVTIAWWVYHARAILRPRLPNQAAVPLSTAAGWLTPVYNLALRPIILWTFMAASPRRSPLFVGLMATWWLLWVAWTGRNYPTLFGLVPAPLSPARLDAAVTTHQLEVAVCATTAGLLVWVNLEIWRTNRPPQF